MSAPSRVGAGSLSHSLEESTRFHSIWGHLLDAYLVHVLVFYTRETFRPTSGHRHLRLRWPLWWNWWTAEEGNWRCCRRWQRSEDNSIHDEADDNSVAEQLITLRVFTGDTNEKWAALALAHWSSSLLSIVCTYQSKTSVSGLDQCVRLRYVEFLCALPKLLPRRFEWNQARGS